MESESWLARSNEKELVETAIQQLVKSKCHHDHDHDHEDEDDHLLTNLLSQLESLKAEGASGEEMEGRASERERDESSREDDVVKQLKKLERQNRITHMLLSALILITAVWQLSEVSLLLKLKHGVTHPFNSFRGFFAGLFKRRDDDKPLTSMEAGADNRLKFARDVQTLIMNDDQE